MNTIHDAKANLPQGTPSAALALLVAAILGAWAAVEFLPEFVPALALSAQGESPKAFWFLSRSSAFIAFVLLWLSTVLGLLMTSRLGQPTLGHLVTFELHEFASILGLAFSSFHALVLLGDRYIGYTLPELLLPFNSTSYRPVEVALGQIAFYLTAVITLSFYVRRWLSARLWRLLHYLSFAAFLLALLHGVSSGTDSGGIGAQALYWVAGGTTLFLTFYRILLSRSRQKP